MSDGPLPTITPMNRPYWEGTAEHELRLRHCHTCGALFRFVRDLCPQCWSDDLGWRVAAGHGTVIARSIVHTAPYESMAARVPYALALIQLAEGPTMMANIIDCNPVTVEIGLAVELAWEQRGDVTIPQFRPVSGAG